MIKKHTSLLILPLYFFLKSTTAYADLILIQSWNMQWLSTKYTHLGPIRQERDWLALRSIFHQSSADILFFQEVDSDNALRRIVPANYTLLFSDRALPSMHFHQFSDVNQYTGIALAPGIRFDNPPDLPLPATKSKSTNYYSKLRWATYIIVYPKNGTPIHLLSVHLKSGCTPSKTFRKTKACRELRSQVAHLAGWIEQRAKKKQRFIIGGDFNYPLAKQGNPVWRQLSASDLKNIILATKELKTHCQVRSKRSAKRVVRHWHLLDHFITSSDITLDKTTQRIYALDDIKRFQLSDHCPIEARLMRDSPDVQR